MIPPATITGLKKMCQAQIKGAQTSTQSEGQELVFGDDSEYKRGGIDALKGVVQIIEAMEKADG
jgi:hypothetical protein